MYYSSFFDGFYQTFLICGAIYAFVFAAWLNGKIRDQDKKIENYVHALKKKS